MRKNDQVIARVSEIYKWIEEQQLANKTIAGQCSACGKCCDFETYNHRLYVTTPEMLYFVGKMGIQDFKHFIERPDCHLDRSDAVRRGVERSIKKDSSTLLRYARNDIEMTTGRCPYLVNDKCSVHAYRFSGCRIFCCKGDATFQSELTEAVLKKFKALCAELQIPYRYVDLPAALKYFLTAEYPE